MLQIRIPNFSFNKYSSGAVNYEIQYHFQLKLKYMSFDSFLKQIVFFEYSACQFFIFLNFFGTFSVTSLPLGLKGFSGTLHWLQKNFQIGGEIS